MARFVRLLRFFTWVCGLAIFGTGLLLSSFYLLLTPSLPSAEQLKNVQFQIPLRIYSADKKLIAEFGEKRRTPVKIDKVPETLMQAFLAAEDARFFDHHGIDLKGLTRASLELASTGSIQSGGSTITMQVAKNFFLSQEKTFTRKFNEILLALQIEQELTKDEILELYLNKIYLGNRAYGIEAAANVYYGKSIQELSLAQCAMIAGLPKAPSRYNPLANPQRALARRNWILDRMVELGFVTKAEHDEAIAQTASASYHGPSQDIDAPYIAEMARQELVQRFGEATYETGYRVFLTIDSNLQKTAQEALRKGLIDYSLRHGYYGPEQTLSIANLGDDEIATQLAAIGKVGGLSAAAVVAISKDSVSALLASGEKIEITWDGLKWARQHLSADRMGPSPKTAADILQVGDVIRVQFDTEQNQWQLSQIPRVQGALVAINPNNGGLIALVGGFDYYHSKFNRAVQAARQPGSNFKPFVYLDGLESGMTAATLINDAPVVFADPQLETAWRPENSGGGFNGPTRLRQALYQSRNLVSIRLLRSLGVDQAISYVSRFGFSPENLPRNLSLALGTASLTPFEVATGYSMLANGGYRISPHFIARIEDSQGNEIYQANPPVVCTTCALPSDADATDTLIDQAKNSQVPVAEQIADSRSVYIMHSILKDVILKGTGRRAMVLGRNDLAGKTGTTNDQVDAWFSGFNPDIEATVWVGFDQPQTLGRVEFGARAALPVWIDFMRAALTGKPERHLPQPPGIVSVKIDPQTGLRATADTLDPIFEIFKVENAPPEPSPTGNGIPSSDEGGGLAPEDIF